MLAKLKKLLKEINEKEIADSGLKRALKEYFTNALEVSIRKIEENAKLERIERIILNNFSQSEELGWKIKDTEEILDYWLKLASILKFENFEQKINYFSQEITNTEKIEKLKYLKENKRICAPASAPIFHQAIERLMNTVVDNVILQLNKSERIDKMLEIFDRDLERFENLVTADYDFGDTEDRECVGKFYMDIMSILGFEYSRGVLNARL